MPHHPEDDWTRPIPRTPRPERRGGSSWRDREFVEGNDYDYGYEDGAQGYDEGWDEPAQRRRAPRQDETQYIPRSPRRDQTRPHRTAPERRPQEQGARPSAPPRRPAGRSAATAPRPPVRRKRYGVRRALAVLALLVLAYVVTMAVVVAQIWGSIGRVDAEPENAARPSGGAGQNFVLVGTDGRENLTPEQRNELGTGFTDGTRADTVMLLHVPTFGDPALVSLPRDSFVEIPGYGWNKLNAAHSLGGAQLLVDTVEQATDLRVDGYLEIGFDGFVQVVEEVDGVRMCLPEAIQDEKAHLDLPAGCQDLSGTDALGYVRMRYSDPRGDIGRVERQRQFLSALVSKMASPATVLNPLRLHSVGTATGGALTMGEDTSMLEAGRIALGMRAVASGKGNSLTVPVADANYPTHAGSAVLWNEAGAAELFGALRDGTPLTVEP